MTWSHEIWLFTSKCPDLCLTGYLFLFVMIKHSLLPHLPTLYFVLFILYGLSKLAWKWGLKLFKYSTYSMVHKLLRKSMFFIFQAAVQLPICLCFNNLAWFAHYLAIFTCFPSAFLYLNMSFSVLFYDLYGIMVGSQSWFRQFSLRWM